MSATRRAICAIATSIAVLLPASAIAQHRPAAPPRTSFAEPAIAPDGREIAFVSGGEIWAVPTAGGDARLLVSHPATESRPIYSPGVNDDA